MSLRLTHNDRSIQMNIGLGLAPDMKNISIFGSTPDSNATEQFVWELGGALSTIGKFPVTAQQIFASSSDTNETVTITVTYLDENSVEVIEEVILNGFVGVPLSKLCRRINSIINISTSNMLGNIYLGTESAPVSGVPTLANTMGYADVLKQRDSSLAYSVPLGYTLLVTHFAGGNTRNEENHLIGFFTLGETNVLIQGLAILLTSQYVDLGIAYTALKEKSDIIVTTKSNTGNNDIVRGRVQGILVANDLLGES